MRGLKRNPWLSGLGVLLAILVLYGGHARADVTTDQSGSIIIFPKVIADGTRDTLIQITNTQNVSASAHCFYVDNSDFNCTVIDFDIFLTGQQPTMWRVSTGRLQSIYGASCRLGQLCTCTLQETVPGSGVFSELCPGFAPGTAEGSLAIKPTTPGFRGELKCVQTDGDVPFGGNSLKGEAIIEDLATGVASEYNAISISAKSVPSNTTTLPLDDIAYNSCPQSLVLNSYAEGATEAVESVNATVTTELTLVPCTEFMEEGIATPAQVNFDIYDEFEQHTSFDAFPFACVSNRFLSSIATTWDASGHVRNGVPSLVLKTRITPSSGSICYGGFDGCTVIGDQKFGNCSCSTSNPCLDPDGVCRPWPGVVGVAEEFHTVPGVPDPVVTGTAAFNLVLEGKRGTIAGNPGDVIRAPQWSVAP